MSQKLPSRDTVEKWICEIRELQFDGNELHCTACDVLVSWNKKSIVTKHVESEKHRCRVSGDVTTRERQKEFNLDLLKMMVTCNIPFDKLNNPCYRQFLENCINYKYNNVTVPSESTLRKNYLPLLSNDTCCYYLMTSAIKSELYNRNVWISVDETMDTSGRRIANVIIGGMDETMPMKSHLISSKVLRKTNAQTISEYVDASLKELWGENAENNKGRFLLYITDTAAYMKVSADVLKITYNYINLVHMMCLANGLHRIAETIRACYPTVDKLIATVKKIFFKPPSRQKLFHKKLPDTPLPPEPIVTRWGTWLKAASYYYIHYDNIKNVINQINAEDAVAISKEIFQDSTVYEDLAYIHGNFSRIYLAIERLEYAHTSPDYSIINAVNIIFDLRHFIFQLRHPSAERVQNEFQTVLHNNPGFETICCIADLILGKEVDFSKKGVNIPSLGNFRIFKYAPLVKYNVT